VLGVFMAEEAERPEGSLLSVGDWTGEEATRDAGRSRARKSDRDS
jgi:hypothetical protein